MSIPQKPTQTPEQVAAADAAAGGPGASPPAPPVQDPPAPPAAETKGKGKDKDKPARATRKSKNDPNGAELEEIEDFAGKANFRATKGYDVRDTGGTIIVPTDGTRKPITLTPYLQRQYKHGVIEVVPAGKDD